jgi:hypothetical protein
MECSFPDLLAVIIGRARKGRINKKPNETNLVPYWEMSEPIESEQSSGVPRTARIAEIEAISRRDPELAEGESLLPKSRA